MAEIVAACAMSEAGVSKRVALKRIRTESAADPLFVARFFDEVRLAMQLSHANVVQVFDFGRTEDTRLLPGDGVRRGGRRAAAAARPGGERLPPAEALHVVAQHAARPRLRAPAHRPRQPPAGHRPPGRQAGERAAVVRGRGEADRLRRRALARRAPPDRRHQRHDPVHVAGAGARRAASILRSDVFSAGVLLYALLSGECPFGEEDTERTLEQVRLCRYRPPVQVDRFERFDALLRRALDPRAPSERFPSAGAFADAIDELMFAQGWRGGAAALRDRRARRVPARARAPERAVRAGPAARGARGRASRERAREGKARCCRAWRCAEPPRRQTVAADDASRARGIAAGAWTTAIGRPGGDRGRRRRSSWSCASAPPNDRAAVTPRGAPPPAQPIAAPPRPDPARDQSSPSPTPTRRAHAAQPAARAAPRRRWARCPSTPARGAPSTSTAGSPGRRRCCVSRCAPAAPGRDREPEAGAQGRRRAASSPRRTRR